MNDITDKMTANEFRALLRGEKSPTSTSNRKVVNAAKIEQNGVVFDSRLECYMHQKRYTLQEAFKYNGETIRAITYTLDFYLPYYYMAIDTKGVATQQGQLRIKMLKRLFADLGRTTEIELPRTTAECDALVARIIGKRE